ncbi:hypothetical protein evm_010232 [Chilo suppressalis]|nr:hypothetical protein evm_010232 [Chilo suppressalis]
MEGVCVNCVSAGGSMIRASHYICHPCWQRVDRAALHYSTPSTSRASSESSTTMTLRCAICRIRLNKERRHILDNDTIVVTASDYICGPCHTLFINRGLALSSQHSQEMIAGHEHIHPREIRLLDALCHGCYRNAERVAVNTELQANPVPQNAQQIILPNYSRASDTHNRCIFLQCQGTSFRLIPLVLRVRLIKDYKYYIPPGCRICEMQLARQSWDDPINIENVNRSFTAAYIEDFSELLKVDHNVLDFENIQQMDDNLLWYWVGRTKQQFTELLTELPQFPNKSTSLGAYLMKLRTGDSDDRIATLLNIASSTLSKLITKAREIMEEHFMPAHLGLQQINRQVATRNLYIPKLLFGNPATKSDADIVKEEFHETKPMRQYFREGDVMILDRGFRDSIPFLERLRYSVHYPLSLESGEHQLSTEHANESRKVTLSRLGGGSVKDLKKKRDNLMSTYRRQRTKVRESMGTGSGAEDVYKPEWPFYDLLASFLDVIYKPKKTKSSELKEVLVAALIGIFLSDNKKDPLYSEEIEEEEHDNNTTATMEQSATTAQPATIKTPKTLEKNKSKRSRSNECDELKKRSEEAYNIMKQMSQTESDTSLLYCNLLCNKLRGLKESTRDIAMMEIDKIMYTLKQQDNHARNFPNSVYQNIHFPISQQLYNSQPSPQYQVSLQSPGYSHSSNSQPSPGNLHSSNPLLSPQYKASLPSPVSLPSPGNPHSSNSLPSPQYQVSLPSPGYSHSTNSQSSPQHQVSLPTPGKVHSSNPQPSPQYQVSLPSPGSERDLNGFIRACERFFITFPGDEVTKVNLVLSRLSSEAANTIYRGNLDFSWQSIKALLLQRYGRWAVKIEDIITKIQNIQPSTERIVPFIHDLDEIVSDIEQIKLLQRHELVDNKVETLYT